MEHGIPFSANADYDVTLAGFGPYGSVDEACGPAGLGASEPTENRWSYSASTAVTFGHP